MEFYREITPILMKRAEQFRIVTLTGPRQSGKTTLCRKVFPNKLYISLEDPDVRRHCINDPRSFLKKISSGAILDEIQRVPEFLSYLQSFVDEKNEKGLFILTGSNQLGLIESVSQSLAGRTAMLQLLPLQYKEIKSNYKDDWKELALNGWYPGCIKDEISPQVFYKSYFETYVEKDVRSLIQIKNLLLFDKFMKLLAGRCGQLLEYSSIAAEVGVSSHTIKEWFSVLEASYIVFRLPPFFENLKKRLTKSPKMYFLDTGLLCYLLGIKNVNDLDSHPMGGFIFENFIACDLLKKYVHHGDSYPMYFYRDQSGTEVDFLWKDSGSFHLMEVKSSMTFHSSFSKSMAKVDELLHSKNSKGKSSTANTAKTLLYDGESMGEERGVQIRNWREILLD